MRLAVLLFLGGIASAYPLKPAQASQLVPRQHPQQQQSGQAHAAANQPAAPGSQHPALRTNNDPFLTGPAYPSLKEVHPKYRDPPSSQPPWKSTSREQTKTPPLTHEKILFNPERGPSHWELPKQP